MNTEEAIIERLHGFGFDKVVKNISRESFTNLARFSRQDWEFAGCSAKVANELYLELHQVPNDAYEGGCVTKTPELISKIGRLLERYGIDLCSPGELRLYIEHLIERYAPNWETLAKTAKFANNCLEIGLDEPIGTSDNILFDNKDNIKVLLAPSGAGKTRSLLELLYNNYGYYFVGGGSLGSGDMEYCRMRSSPGNARQNLELLYFVREVVCDYLIKKSYNRPDQILLAQIHPRLFFGTDLFKCIYSYLMKYNRMGSCAGPRNPFKLLVIDEIQTYLLDSRFRSPRWEHQRPFLSPLLKHTKDLHKFRHVVISGTNMDFNLLSELVTTGFEPDDNKRSKVVGYFAPLGVERVVRFCNKIFKHHGLEFSQDLLEFVKSHTLLHGRARIFACVLDKYFDLPENERNIEQCYDGFYRVLMNLHNSLNPSRYLLQYIEGRNNRLQRLIGSNALQTKLSAAIANYIVSGYGAVYASDNLAAQMIHCGIGYGDVNDFGRVINAELLEESVIVCLRSFVPFENIAKTIALEIKPKIEPKLFVYGLEYMVAYSLVALLTKGDRSVLSHIKAYNGSLSDYLSDQTKDNVVCIPDNACGPDIVYKFNNTLYLMQIKFSDTLTLQKRQRACDTTDPKKFYCERNDPAKVIAGYESIRESALRAFEESGLPIVRIIFLHKNTKTLKDIDEGVTVIDETKNPDFFDCLYDDEKDKGKLWAKLDKIREKLDARKSE